MFYFRIFFRRHYIMLDVIHCGVDPKGRKINLKPFVKDLGREVGSVVHISFWPNDEAEFYFEW